MLYIINSPTWILENLASIIDNIVTTDVFNNSLKKRYDWIRCFWSFSNIFINLIDGNKTGNCFKNWKMSFQGTTYINAGENNRWRQKSFTPLRKIYLLIYVRFKRHFPMTSSSTYFHQVFVRVNITCV